MRRHVNALKDTCAHSRGHILSVCLSVCLSVSLSLSISLSPSLPLSGSLCLCLSLSLSLALALALCFKDVKQLCTVSVIYVKKCVVLLLSQHVVATWASMVWLNSHAFKPQGIYCLFNVAASLVCVVIRVLPAHCLAVFLVRCPPPQLGLVACLLA